jgi:Arc/MetJ-type ribon-helix-helix transcriptional regulator
VTIHLPVDLEDLIRAEVKAGRFPSVDEAMAEAARLLLRQGEAREHEPSSGPINEAEFKQRLIDSGFMVSMPIPADRGAVRSSPPATLEGEPLSETIIRERRR